MWALVITFMCCGQPPQVDVGHYASKVECMQRGDGWTTPAADPNHVLRGYTCRWLGKR